MGSCGVTLLASSGVEVGVVAGVIAVLFVAIVFVSSAFRVVTEYERSVFFRLGHVRPDAKGPGLIFRIPIVDRLVKVTLRVEVVDIPPQAVITKDNVTIQVDAVVYFQVVEPIQAVIGVDNFRFASQRIAMTSLRTIIGRHERDDLLVHRENVNNELRTVIAASTHHGASRSVRWSCVTSRCRPSCCERWRDKPRQSAKGGRRLSPPLESYRRARSWRRLLPGSMSRPVRSSCVPCKPLPRWQASTTRRSCSLCPSSC